MPRSRVVDPAAGSDSEQLLGSVFVAERCMRRRFEHIGRDGAVRSRACRAACPAMTGHRAFCSPANNAIPRCAARSARSPASSFLSRARTRFAVAASNTGGPHCTAVPSDSVTNSPLHPRYRRRVTLRNSFRHCCRPPGPVPWSEGAAASSPRRCWTRSHGCCGSTMPSATTCTCCPGRARR